MKHLFLLFGIASPYPPDSLTARLDGKLSLSSSARETGRTSGLEAGDRRSATSRSTLLASPNSDAPANKLDTTDDPVRAARSAPGRTIEAKLGCIGDATSDATACLATALQDTPPGGTLTIGKGIYLISSPLKVPAGVTVMGGGGSGGTYSQTCLAGIRTNNPTQDALIMAAGSKLVGICIDTAVPKTAGSGVNARGANTVTIADSAIYNQLIGVDISGEAGANKPIQAVKTILRDTSIVTPPDGNAIGIRIGADSMYSNTTGVYLLNNYIVCQHKLGTGTVVLDAGGLFMSGNNRFGCDIGTKIIPGVNQQVVWGTAGNNEILGDTDQSHALFIDTRSTSSKIAGFQFVGSWTSYSTTGSTVLIQNTGKGTIAGLHFSAHRFYGAPTNHTILDIRAGSGITVTGSTLCSSSDTIAPLIAISGAANEIDISSNSIGSCDNDTRGKITTGIQVATTSQDFGTIVGNTFPSVETPLRWAATYGNATRAVIGFNKGIDDITASLASAARVTLPANSTVSIVGTNPLSSIEGGWSNRQVQLHFPNGGSIDNRGNICKGRALSRFDSVTVTYDATLSCWLAR